MQTTFLPWSEPFVPAVTRWLMEGAGAAGDAEGVVDLGRTVCVTPGRRGGRILLGMLARACAAAGLDLMPPRTITPGTIAEALLVVDAPTATREESILAWTAALRAANPDSIAALLPVPPGPDDLPAWHGLARTIQHLHETLSGERLAFAEVPERAEGLELFAESDRWRTLARLAEDYGRTLEGCGLVDPHAANHAALEAGRLRTERDVVLVGVTELGRGQRAILEALAPRVGILLHAPEEEHASFDAFGRPLPAAWEERELPIGDERLVVADEPRDQARAAMIAIAGFEGARAANEITIGLGDPELGPTVARAADTAGLGVHDAAGTELRRTAPWRLLEAAGTWLDGRRWRDLAALVRHPDLEAWLAGRPAGDPDDDEHDHLTILDDYLSRHLQERAGAAWLGGPKHIAPLQRLVEAVDDLLRPLAGPDRPLGAWCAPLLEVVGAVYESAPPDEAAGGGAAAKLEACVRLRDAFARHAAAAGPLQPATDVTTALRLLLADAAGEAIAADVHAEEVEMLGWLELHLDPAPALVLLGLNDGRVPQTVHGDPFLPDTLREALDLPHNRQRFARDAYLLEALARSRADLMIVTGRRSADGDPLRPSRLLLACGDETMVARIGVLCGDGDGDDASDAGPRPLPFGAPEPAAVSAFVVPDIPAGFEPPASMSVTSFKHYLACPYRYALKYLLKLKPFADDARELDALQFGNLAHQALDRFGSDEAIRDERDASAIEAYLRDALAAEARDMLGSAPLPAVRLQLARLEQRLVAFAGVQVRLRAEGWAIRHSELKFDGESSLDVPGQDAMPLRGKIDRIDQHEGSGAWRIVDYKTGERGLSPHEEHHGRKRVPDDGQLAWKDLQLPLYRHLARQQGVVEGEPELAYFVLPRKPDDVGLVPAAWSRDHLEHALDTARGIVCDIRAGRFERNSDHHPRFDDFARICQTLVLAAGDDDGDNAVAGVGGEGGAA